MSVKRKEGQHQAQIRQIRRDIFINTPIIVGCLIATICAYVFHWHIVVKVLLTLVSFMQLMHLPSLFTRLQDQKKKLVGIETKTKK
jgi:hypothetical protein